MITKENFNLGTVVYLDGVKSHLGMVGGFTKDDFGDEAYILSCIIIDGDISLNNCGCDEDFIYPLNSCSKASEKDTDYFCNRMMNNQLNK